MINGYCEEKYNPVKKIFENYFLNQEEIGASFAIYKEGRPLIDLWGGFKNKNNQKWEENTIVNVFSATKGIYEIIVSILIDQNILDLEKSVSYYWDAFKQSNKREIKLKHILSHQSGLYRFKEKVTNKDFLDWNKIISILEKQEPDHKPGEKTYYHAKTHGFLVGEIIKRTTKKTIGNLIDEHLFKKRNLNFFVGVNEKNIFNIATLYQNKTENKKITEFNAFNNPDHEIEFYNNKICQLSEIPSMNGHGNAKSIAKIYDIVCQDLVFDKKNLLSKNIINKCLKESISRTDQSLMLPIRWSEIGLILRGGWLFGPNKESFGHNGWGGSLGFADPILKLGLGYATNKINSNMSGDLRITTLIKKFYELH
jgi:CubicO group peptidase (beta-lactamase class C family)